MRPSNKWIPIIALIVVLGILGGFFLGKSANNDADSASEPETAENTPQQTTGDETALSQEQVTVPTQPDEPTGNPAGAAAADPIGNLAGAAAAEPTETSAVVDPVPGGHCMDVRYIVNTNSPAYVRKNPVEKMIDAVKLGEIRPAEAVEVLYEYNDEYSYIRYGSLEGYMKNKYMSSNPFYENSWLWSWGDTNDKKAAITTTFDATGYGKYSGKTLDGWSYLEGTCYWDSDNCTFVMSDSFGNNMGHYQSVENTYSATYVATDIVTSAGHSFKLESILYTQFKDYTGLK